MFLLMLCTVIMIITEQVIMQKYVLVRKFEPLILSNIFTVYCVYWSVCSCLTQLILFDGRDVFIFST